MQNNKMCKIIRCAKNNVLGISNMNMNTNRRDVQTGCSGYVHKNTGDENMYVFQ